MKAIINGLRYNTQTATFVGAADSGTGHGDFNYWDAALYRTRNGRYFLAGEGHGNTMFCNTFPDGMRGMGERIIPLDDADALDWAERHLPTALIEAAFGTLVQDA